MKGGPAHTQDDERADFVACLGDVAEAAAERTLGLLAGLDDRKSDADRDRGARSAEALMRVASAAAVLRARLQKEASENAEDPSDEGDIEAAARSLARRYEKELARLERDVLPPQEEVPAGGGA